MPSKFRVRYIFRPLVKLISKGLNKIGVTPNMATIMMLSSAILSFIMLVYFSNLLTFGMLIFVCGILDGCDGEIARLTNKSSAFGGFFDSIMDRFSEFIIFLALLIYSWEYLLWNIIEMKIIIFLTFLSSIMISYTRTRAENFFKEGDFDIGLMARSERLFYLVITSLLAFFYGSFMELLFLFMWLILGTTIFRFLKIRKQLKNREKKIIRNP